MPLMQIIVPYQEGYDYGIGVDSASGPPLGKAVSGTPSSAFGLHALDKASFVLDRIDDTAKLMDTLNASADASCGFGPFSASERFKFARDVKIQTYSLNLMVSKWFRLPFQQIDKPVSEPEAAALGCVDGFGQD